MENYQKVIKKRITVIAVLMVAVGCIIVWDQFFASENLRQNNLYEFQLGLLVGLAFIGVIRIMKLNKILKDEKLIRLAYNDEHDERRRAVREKSGLPVILYFSIALIVAGIIAGYFNITVFYTLIAAGLCQLNVACVLKLINMKRM